MALTYAGPIPSVALAFGSTTHTLEALTGACYVNAQGGGDATIRSARKVVASHGSFALNGQQATLTPDTGGDFWFPAPLPSIGMLDFDVEGEIAAIFGGITVNGQAATFQTGRGIVASTGTIAFAGPPSLSDFEVTPTHTTYALTGQSATLNKSYLALTASAGSFALSGPQVSITRETPTAKVLDALTGTFNIADSTATFTPVQHVMTASVGSFAINGQDAEFPELVWVQITRSAGSWTIVIPAESTWT
jgi:hypothetical protein